MEDGKTIDFNIIKNSKVYMVIYKILIFINKSSSFYAKF